MCCDDVFYQLFKYISKVSNSWILFNIKVKGYRVLEPYAVKVACTVLEGLGVGNDLRLLTIQRKHQKSKYRQNGDKTLSGKRM